MGLLAAIVGIVLGGGVVAYLARRRSGGAPKAVRIDAFAIGEPWRRHVSSAVSAQRRYGEIVGSMQEGPLRERMVEVGWQVQRGVEECWEIARRGDHLDDTIRRLDGASLQRKLDRASDAVEQVSLRGQIESVDRVRTARNNADERLRVLQTRLGELVTQAAEVSMGVDHTAELGSAVDEVVTQLEALRAAVRDVNDPPGTAMPST